MNERRLPSSVRPRRDLTVTRAFRSRTNRRHTRRHAAAYALLLALCAASAPPAARAENPVDADNRRLAAEVLRAGSSPRGVVPLLTLFSHWDQSTPQRLIAELEKLAQAPRLSASQRVLIETMLAQARMRLGDPDAVDARFAELGYVTQVRVIGPFDNEGKAGFDAVTPVEEKRMEAPDLLASYPGDERPVAWRELPDVVRGGFVSFGAVLRPFENVCALAETFVHSERARPLSLWAGAGGAVKVYWNGTEVLRDESYRHPSPDRNVAMVGAHKGFNRVLVKVCTTQGAWGFQLRIGDERGAVAQGLSYALQTTEALNIPPGHAKLRLPKPPQTPLAFFVAQERAPKPQASLLADYARYLHLTGSDDPAERRAQQLAERAAELSSDPEHLALAAQLAEQRAEIMRFADRARALHPDDPRVLLLQASVRARGPSPQDALPLLDRIDQSTPGDSEERIAATLLRVDLHRDLELPGSARALLQKVHARVGDTAELLRRLSEADQDAGDPDAALRHAQAVLALRYDDTEMRRLLIDDALARGDQKSVLEHADALRALTPGSARTLLYIAGLYDALGRDDMVLATYRDALEIAPEAQGIYVAYGRALLRGEQSEAAADMFKKALALKPQDAQTRELLEDMRPQTRKDEAYAVASDSLLSRKPEPNGYPYTVLQDLTVKTVFENGLGSTFRQLAVQVHDKEGARRFRTHSFAYDPDAQRVDLRLSRVYRKDGRVLESVRTYEEQLGEPWYRLYYDTRAVVVIFPDLEPGDVVEVRYRIDDVAHRNLFADYFGDLHMWQDYVPVLHAEYVLDTPVTREIFSNEPAFRGLAHTRKLEDRRRIDRYVAENLPALVAEEGAPGATEQSPYLHVSTYRSWQDVGRWYWGLIKDQLYADQSLQRRVRELVEGAKTTREKVERIHAWAVGHTRYVGLEFGIHGFLPYRVPLVVQRGFGDCKDKASLLYTMLREAGIDARIVLVRTHRNGDIATTPASLAAFDHAITYVPELDLYLDGTAEHSGVSELPSEDQGVMVLLVGPEGAELRRTPVLSADKNLRTRTLKVQLSASGAARIDGEEEIIGSEAAGYRDYYEAPGTRAERFERTLGTVYPGVELQKQRFENLDDLSAPVRYAYELRVPQLGHWEGSALQVPPSSLDGTLRSMARSPTRMHPLELGSPRTYVEQRSISFPASMRAAELPQDSEASSPWGALALRYEKQPDGVQVRTELRVLRDRVETKDYPAFRRWVEAADLLLRQRISIGRGEP